MRPTVELSTSECAALLPHISAVDTIIQVGLGNWHEGESLLAKFPNATFFAIEPLTKFVSAAKSKGFPGKIETALAWHTSGVTLAFSNRGERSSALIDDRGRVTTARTITLDDAFANDPNLGEKVFLWMDCEGSELRALQGASKILPKTEYLVSECCWNPRKKYAPSKGYTTEAQLYEWVEANGFQLITRHRALRLFRRKKATQ